MSGISRESMTSRLNNGRNCWSAQLIGLPGRRTAARFTFLRSLKEHGVIRVSIQTGKIERVADLKGFQNAGWIGLWMGLDPTDAPLFLRNVGSEDIYALTLDRK